MDSLDHLVYLLMKRKEIYASDILVELKNGFGVEYRDVIIIGDLDLNNLIFPIQCIERSFDEINDGSSEYLKCVTSKIKITGSDFYGILDLKNIIFEDIIQFDGSTFHKDIYFNGAIFKNSVSFRGTEFKGSANFCYARSKHLNFWGAHFYGSINFKKCNIQDDAYFLGSRFDSFVLFEGTIFRAQALFMGTKFFNETSFKESIFFRVADFSGVRFLKQANFEYAVFYGSADFMATRFHEDANFNYTIFKKSCYFGENTKRNGAKFYKNSSFQCTEFNGYTRFVYAKFYSHNEEYTYFPSIHFGCTPCKENSKLHSSFINSRFNDRIDFYKAIFEIDAYFENVIFAKDSNFSSIRFDGIASFFRAKFSGNVASFENSNFFNDADFCGTFFAKYANFKNSKFAREANFRATYFNGDALFNEANFNENFNLSEAKISFLKLSRATFAEISLISLMDSIFSQIDIPWVSIENRLYRDKYLDYNNSYNDGVYLSLIQSYERSGNFDDADACRLQYKNDMYQLSIKKRQLSAKWFPFVSYFVDRFFFGYGARLKYPSVMMIIALCLYMFLYARESYTVSSSDLDLTKVIIANLLGWFIVPIFVVVLAKKFLR
jgi:uncharacterized protein YjbI with pentapeptide repeats